jgi:hypothetical protein
MLFYYGLNIRVRIDCDRKANNENLPPEEKEQGGRLKKNYRGVEIYV